MSSNEEAHSCSSAGFCEGDDSFSSITYNLFCELIEIGWSVLCRSPIGPRLVEKNNARRTKNKRASCDGFVQNHRRLDGNLIVPRKIVRVFW